VRKALTVLVLTLAGVVALAPAASANQCLQFPNVPGTQQLEVCIENPIELR